MMRQSGFRVAMKFARGLALLGILGVSSTFVEAQDTTRNQRPVQIDPDKPTNDSSGRFNPIEEEMKAKRAITYAEKEYQENLDRARDLSTLGASIVSSFKQKKALNHDDFKKLDKVEKLAKGIRRAAGGSEDDTEMEKPPTDIAAAVDMLETLSQSLKSKVEKTPKHVISAAVIDEANVLLELVRIVRTFRAKV